MFFFELEKAPKYSIKSVFPTDEYSICMFKCARDWEKVQGEERGNTFGSLSCSAQKFTDLFCV